VEGAEHVVRLLTALVVAREPELEGVARHFDRHRPAGADMGRRCLQRGEGATRVAVRLFGEKA